MKTLKAFIKSESGNKVHEYRCTVYDDIVGDTRVEVREHDNYMTMYFIDETQEGRVTIEHKCTYEKHKQILEELFEKGYVGINMDSGTRVFVKRNYSGSVRKSDKSFRACSVEFHKIKWGADERDGIMALENKNKLSLKEKN